MSTVFDAHKNFAYTTITSAPTPATSGTTISVADGTVFPATPFNATVWALGSQPLASNAEIVRVTNVTGNTLTIVRTQESSIARAIVVGDQIAETITRKVATDIEGAVNTLEVNILVPYPTLSTLVDGATPALDASLGNIYLLTAAGDRTIAVPTNPLSGKKIIIIHTASGGNRTLSLNTGAGGFHFGSDITGLTITPSGTSDYIGCIYNLAQTRWDVIAYVKGY